MKKDWQRNTGGRKAAEHRHLRHDTFPSWPESPPALCKRPHAEVSRQLRQRDNHVVRSFAGTVAHCMPLFVTASSKVVVMILTSWFDGCSNPGGQTADQRRQR